MKRLILSSILLTLVFVSFQKAQAHCQIPCGIYHDELRFEMIMEDIETIEKSMNQINEISQAEDKNYNQLVRWVNNKELHAQKIQDVVSEYFLAQRVKITASDDPKYNDYVKSLELLHQMTVYAMKTKQTTDLENVEKLKTATKEYQKLYFKDHDEGHTKEKK
ncbi:MAG: superoxide dismutase [Thermodesulfobacteriales bacterium]|jgi:nickel superoxide dismutase|nr:MAG: superoxide dismutase [Thermodesulfobacteriales bacterium]